MDSCFQNLAIMLMVLKVLKADALPDDTEACSNHTVISDRTRLLHYSQTLYNCDADLVEGWYKFEVNGAAAQIPRICLKNNICGTRLPLRLDLGDQSLPTPNTTVWAHVCTSFDILDKWDCCVLRQRAGIKNCGDYFVYHLRPTDRCDVAYCMQETGTNPSKEYTAKTGDSTHESMSLESLSASVTTDALYVNTSQAMAETTSQTENPCPQSLGFQCSRDESRTCYNSTNKSGRHVMLVECSDGRGCGEACDNIGDCHDDSDEHVNLCLSVICNEDMQLCPDGSSCFIPCDGIRNCNDGSDEQGCRQTLESLAEPTAQTDTNIRVTELITSYSGDTRKTFPTATIPLSTEAVSSTTVFLSDASSNIQSTSFTDSDYSLYRSPSILTSRNSEPSLQTLESITPSLLASTTGLTIVPSESEIFSTPIASLPTVVTSPLVQPASSTEVSASIITETSSLIIGNSILESSPEVSPTTGFLPSTEITGAERTSLTPEGIVSSVIPITASDATTADTLLTRPIILTFDIIGTAYRNVEDTFEEPTFEELLQEAIAGVLNEYSNRNRRSVQNFTEDDIEVQNITFHVDNATVSVKVNSTKEGEEYVPANELETVFNNQSAMELLCKKLFGESSMQTTAVTGSVDVITSPLMSSATAQSTPSVERVLQVSSQISSLMTSIQPSFTSFTEEILPTASAASASREPTTVSSGLILESDIGSGSVTQSTSSVKSNILSSLPSQSVETQISTTSAEINVYNRTVTVTESPSEIQQFDNTTLTVSFSTPFVSDISTAVQTVGTETPPPTTTLLSDTLKPPAATTITSIEAAQTIQSEMITTVLPDTLEPSAAIIITSSEGAHMVQTEVTTTLLLDTLEPSLASEIVQTVETEMTPIVLSPIPEQSPATVTISPEFSEMSSIMPTPIVSVYLSEATSQPSSSVSIQLTTSQLSSSVSTTAAYLATSDSAANIPMTSALLSAATPIVEHSPTLAPSQAIFKIHSKSSSLLMIPSVTTEYSEVLSDTFVKSLSESSSRSVTQSTAVRSSSGTEEYLGIAPSSPYSSTTPSVAHSMYSQSFTASVTPLETETYISSVRSLETETHTIPVTSLETETYTTSVASLWTETYTTSVTPSETGTYTTPVTSLDTETYEVPSRDNTTTSTRTIATSTERNLIIEKPDIIEDEDTFQQNIGLFIFLIVGGACIVGAFLFALVGSIYRRRRRHTWDPRMAYQDAYADMEKANLSFHRDNLGIESPIPDIDILKGEPTEQETSLSKASTMTLPPTPKNEASQTDPSPDAGPSDDSCPLNQAYASTSPRYDSTTPNQAGSSGCENRGFEEDRDSGVDGIVPVDEIDNTYPRKEFPWIEQLADTRL